MLRAILRRLFAFLRRSRSKPVLVLGVSRREFLQLTGAAGAVALLPGPVAEGWEDVTWKGEPFSLFKLEQYQKMVVDEFQSQFEDQLINGDYGADPYVIFTSEKGFKNLKKSLRSQQQFTAAEAPSGFQRLYFDGVEVQVQERVLADPVVAGRRGLAIHPGAGAAVLLALRRGVRPPWVRRVSGCQ